MISVEPRSSRVTPHKLSATTRGHAARRFSNTSVAVPNVPAAHRERILHCRPTGPDPLQRDDGRHGCLNTRFSVDLRLLNQEQNQDRRRLAGNVG